MQKYRSMSKFLYVKLILLTILNGYACDDTNDPPPFPNLPLSGSEVSDEDGGIIGGETIAGETVAGETIAGETIAGETVAGETVAGEIVAGETVAGETVAGEIVSPAFWGAKRSCDLILSFNSVSASRVQLAGSFTSWADNPLEMNKQGDTFSINLNNQALNLTEGERYPYKFIVDNQWILDPLNQQQQFDGQCVNSAFIVPKCSESNLVIQNLETNFNNESQLGSLTGEILIELPELAQDIGEISLHIDNVAHPYEMNREEGTITFDVEGLESGKHWLKVRVTDDQGLPSPEKKVSFWIEDRPFHWQDTAMYMLLVDRFANGDPSNDAPIGEPVGYSADWHGGDLQGATAALEDGYFDRLGIKAIWLSPINRQVEGHFPDRVGEGRRFSSYHGYWPISGREIDIRYGGAEGLREFVNAAHARGIRVLLDLINNQVHEQHEYYQSNPEWFRRSCVCGLDPGCGWSERPLDCLFASYLPDINWRESGAEQQFIADAVYWVDEFDVDGFRVDAVKHVETTSIYNLRSALTTHFEGDGQGERIWMFGETAVGESDSFNDGCGVTYQDGYQWIDAYTGEYSLDGQFDFPTHHRIRWPILSGMGSFWEIDNAINDLLTRYKSSALHVRFLGSHDSTRVASEAALDPQLGCRYLDDPACTGLATIPTQEAIYNKLKRGWLLLWTMPGIPLLYYGDEIAMAGGNDPDSRRDMLWTESLASLGMFDPTQEPSSEQSVSSLQEELRTWLADIANLRHLYKTLTQGEWQTIWVWDDIYVYTRYGQSHQGTAEVSVIALSQSSSAQQLDIPIPDFLRAAIANPRLLGTQPELGEGNLEPTADQSSFRLEIPAEKAAVWVWGG